MNSKSTNHAPTINKPPQSAGKWLAVTLILGAMLCALANGATLSPPSVQYMDKFGVNMLNGQVNTSLQTVSIGGEMGLAHSISMYTNHFQRSGQRGYVDKFAGAAVFSQLLGPNQIWPVMRVFDAGGSVDFWIKSGGSYYAGIGNDSATSVSYQAIRDERNKLTIAGSSNEYLDWMKPDGTVTRFRRSANPTVSSPGSVSQTTYPNGFTVYQDFLNRVWTNTGFSLVYQYETDTRPADSVADENAPSGAPAYSIAEWALHNPRYVKAVNNSACAVNSAACLQRLWPTATFTWPRGMPRTMYIGNRIFSVDTPAGTTTYEYQPYDLAKNGEVLVQGFHLGQRLSPRLYKIKPASSTSPVLTYTYKNLWVYTSVGLRDDLFGIEYVPPAGTFPTGMGEWATLVQDAGVILTAKLLNQTNSYEMGLPYMGPGSTQNVGSAVGNVSQVIVNVGATPSNTTSVNSFDGLFFFESKPRNLVTQIRRPSGPIDNLSYTSRGNIETIKTNGVTMSRATYANESLCGSLPKICNQATSIFDAKNNETRYEYHADSGQVARIIPPADQNGKVAETRYDYQALRARYFDGNGVLVEGSPIYLKVAERHCHDSNYAGPTASATCSGGDEVVTRYQYNHDNLLMTSVATTVGNKTLRTCFRYDDLGNKIGETQPKGAMNCN